MNLDAVKIIQKLPGLTLPQGTVLTQLAIFENSQTRQCNPSLALLAQHCHTAKSTVARALKELEAAGLITRTSPPKSSNRRTSYQLHLPDLAVAERDSPVLRVVAERDSAVAERDSTSSGALPPLVAERDSHRSVSKVEKEIEAEVGERASAPKLADGMAEHVPDDWQPDPATLSMHLRTKPLPNHVKWEDQLEVFRLHTFARPFRLRDLDRMFCKWLTQSGQWAKTRPSKKTDNEAATDAARNFLNEQ